MFFSPKDLHKPLNQFQEVGEKYTQTLKAFNIYTPLHLLYTIPVGYNFFPLKEINALTAGEQSAVLIEVVSWSITKGTKKAAKVLCRPFPFCHGPPFYLVFFQKIEAIQKRLRPQTKWFVGGKPEWFHGSLHVTHPGLLCPFFGKKNDFHVVHYPAMRGLEKFFVPRTIALFLRNIPAFPEWIDRSFMQKKQWPSWKEALQKIHHPRCPEDLSPLTLWHERLAFDEIFSHHMAFLKKKYQDLPETPPRALVPKPGLPKDRGGLAKDVTPHTPLLLEHTLEMFGHPLTKDQKKALEDIQKDFKSPFPMHRLLQGDVGSGKSIVAFCAMAIIVAQKHNNHHQHQALLVAPTEILAQQHMARLQAIFHNTPYNVALLTKNTLNKKNILNKIQQQEVAIIVGTHALLEDNLCVPSLGLVVIDEQHRFGVAQRLQLIQKNCQKPHLLLLSATPIPRTLALTKYGNLDISSLREKPQGRLNIQTIVAPSTRLEDVIRLVEKRIAAKESTYWVCPLINDSKTHQHLATVTNRFEDLRIRFGPQVGFVHGRLKAQEKQSTITNFQEQNILLLVSTTAIEVGIDIQCATTIVVEGAERFGLAQLHQLRGRVGRGSQKSLCVLLYTPPLSFVGKKRLHVLRHSQDGFWIAQKDQELRGSGDLLGIRQSGAAFYVFFQEHHHEHLAFAAQKYSRVYGPDFFTHQTTSSLGVLLDLFLGKEGLHVLHAG